MHGGTSGGWQGSYAGVIAAGAARARQVEAKRLGLIAKVPGGWPKGRPRTIRGLIHKARRVMLEARTAMAEGRETGFAGRLNELTGLSLDHLDKVLRMKRGLRKKNPDLAVLRIQTEAAGKVLKAQITVDEGAWRGEQQDRFLRLLERMEAAKKLPKPIDATEP